MESGPDLLLTPVVLLWPFVHSKAGNSERSL